MVKKKKNNNNILPLLLAGGALGAGFLLSRESTPPPPPPVFSITESRAEDPANTHVVGQETTPFLFFAKLNRAVEAGDTPPSFNFVARMTDSVGVREASFAVSFSVGEIERTITVAHLFPLRVIGDVTVDVLNSAGVIVGAFNFVATECEALKVFDPAVNDCVTALSVSFLGFPSEVNLSEEFDVRFDVKSLLSFSHSFARLGVRFYRTNGVLFGASEEDIILTSGEERSIIKRVLLDSGGEYKVEVYFDGDFLHGVTSTLVVREIESFEVSKLAIPAHDVIINESFSCAFELKNTSSFPVEFFAWMEFDKSDLPQPFITPNQRITVQSGEAVFVTWQDQSINQTGQYVVVACATPLNNTANKVCAQRAEGNLFIIPATTSGFEMSFSNVPSSVRADTAYTITLIAKNNTSQNYAAVNFSVGVDYGYGVTKSSVASFDNFNAGSTITLNVPLNVQQAINGSYSMSACVELPFVGWQCQSTGQSLLVDNDTMFDSFFASIMFHKTTGCVNADSTSCPEKTSFIQGNRVYAYSQVPVSVQTDFSINFLWEWYSTTGALLSTVQGTMPPVLMSEWYALWAWQDYSVGNNPKGVGKVVVKAKPDYESTYRVAWIGYFEVK